MNRFSYLRATSIDEAVREAAADPTARFIAGGTNLIDLMKYNVERPTRRDMPLVLEHVRERLAIEQLHREIQRAVGQPPDVVHAHAVRMIDLADGERLALEAIAHVRRCRHGRTVSAALSKRVLRGANA